MHLKPSEIAFEREYRERRRAGAEGLYDSYASDYRDEPACGDLSLPAVKPPK